MNMINEKPHLCNEVNLSNVPETPKEFNSPSDMIYAFHKTYNPNVKFTKQEFKEKIKKINEVIKETKKGSKENSQLKKIKQWMYKDFFRNKNKILNRSKRPNKPNRNISSSNRPNKPNRNINNSNKSNRNANNLKKHDTSLVIKINHVFKNKEITNSEKAFLNDNLHTYSLIDVLVSKKTDWINKKGMYTRQIGQDSIKILIVPNQYEIYINSVWVSSQPLNKTLRSVKIETISVWKFWYEKRLESLRTSYLNDPSFIDQV